MMDRLIKPMDTKKYDYTRLNLNTNYVELVWSEFWRYVVNAPVLSFIYGFYGLAGVIFTVVFGIINLFRD